MLVTAQKFALASTLAFLTFTAAPAQAQLAPDTRTVITTGVVGQISSRHERVHRLARQLEHQARELKREADVHFRNSGRYRQFEAEVTEILRLADHIHDVAHAGGHLHHLRRDVDRLSALYGATERSFDHMVYHHRLDHETVRHLRRALNRVENTISVLRGELTF
jgi:hypothetical protein